MNNNMCEHGEDCVFMYIDINLNKYEIYMCECGVLIDYRNIKNYDTPTHPMTAKELQQLFYDLEA